MGGIEMKKANITSAIVTLVIIVLESLPYGAVLNFGEPNSDGSIGFIRKTYSYFSLTPGGYANFAPFLTAVLSCALMFVIVISIFMEKNALKNASRILSILALLTSLMPLLLGVWYYSVCGLAISILLTGEIILHWVIGREGRRYTH